ncbi:hypothetical protein N9242_04785 [Vicingaceae bacterium]|nr:hypothetical protein [Vicingaceae bacterium]
MDILIYGGGMLGRQVSHLVTNHFADQFRILGFIDDVQPPGIAVVDSLETVGSLDHVASNDQRGPKKVRVVFAIGYTSMQGRWQAYQNVKSKGYDLVSLKHPNSSVEPSADLGEGVIVLAGAIVDQFVVVGDVSYLHNGSIVGENCNIGANNYVSAGATFGGSVVVGNNNFFGINSAVVNDITIGNNNFVNAGALIYRPLGNDLRMVEYREQREVTNK